jgi:signal transduction histidine kinase
MLAIFCVSVALMVLMGFDLEDQIFGYQINQRADRLVTELEETSKSSGTVQAIEMTYFVGRRSLPEWLQKQIDVGWGIGTYELFAEEKGHFHVAIRKVSTGELVYLLFNARPYIKSTPQIKDYLKIILLMGGMTLFISLYFTQAMAKKLSYPIEQMTLALSAGGNATALNKIDTSYADELQALSAAIVERDQRIQSLIERERQFNRDVSHELRTPLTITMGAIELMEQEQLGNKLFLRLKSAVTDMQILTEGVLWLGRDASKKISCDAYRVCQRAVNTHSHLVETKSVEVQLAVEGEMRIPVPEPVAFVIIGNILRNALTHTDTGAVTINVSLGEMIFEDTGVGYGNASDKNTGFGIGLSLVDRLCRHFGLAFDIVSGEEQVGSRVQISW